MKRFSFLQVLILLIGTVLGTLVSRMASGIQALSWLSIGDTFGISPFNVNLGMLQFTFGMTFELTVAGIMGLIIAIAICLWIR